MILSCFALRLIRGSGLPLAGVPQQLRIMALLMIVDGRKQTRVGEIAALLTERKIKRSMIQSCYGTPANLGKGLSLIVECGFIQYVQSAADIWREGLSF